jgi:hypothetical protein
MGIIGGHAAGHLVCQTLPKTTLTSLCETIEARLMPHENVHAISDGTRSSHKTRVKRL